MSKFGNKSEDLLIPWHINGTLTETEMNRVMERTAASPDFARQVREELALAEAWNTEPAALADILAAEDDAVAELEYRLRHDPTEVPERSLFFAGSFKPLAAAAAVIATLTLTIAYPIWVDTRDVDQYQTLTSPQTGAQTPVMQIVFKPDTTERQLRLLLVETNGRLLGEPSASGVYRLALPEGVEPAAFARRLQQHPAVRWAEVETRQ